MLDLTDEVNEVLDSEAGRDAILDLASPPASKSIRIIFKRNFSKTIVDGVEWETYEVYVLGKPEDFADAKQNDMITVDNENFNIEHIELPNYNGFVKVRLTKK